MGTRAAVLSRTLRLRLETQLEGLPSLLSTAGELELQRRPSAGKWSAHEHLAHLARLHTIMVRRLDRILTEPSPPLERYLADEDPGWPEWAACPTEDMLERLTALRYELIAVVEALTPEQLQRQGQHPLFGAMTVPEWLDVFLLHEAHHLYQFLLRLHGG